MPRPKKCRSVCHFPQITAFGPAGDESGRRPPVILTVDEYEVIRLIDKNGLSQEQCGEQMGVARTTVQQVYAAARKKLADVLVDGLPLRIEGGDYRLCDGTPVGQGCGGCFKREINQKYAMQKGEQVMRIAVTYENGQIFQHFGHTEQFKVYDVQDGTVVSAQVVSTNGTGHGALAGILTALQADVLICGGIGGGADAAVAAAGIKLYGGVTGGADAAVAALLTGELAFDPNVHCDHHDHEHGGEAHECGAHGCGQHHCGGH